MLVKTPEVEIHRERSQPLARGFVVEVDTLSGAEWSRALEDFQDANLYQTRAYGQVRWGENKLSHLVLRRDGRIRAIAQLRVMPALGRKYGIAYLRWGPICHLKGEALCKETVGEMAGALFREYAVKRKMFLKVIPNAYDGLERAELFRSAFKRFHLGRFQPGSTYRTLLLDLQPPLDQLRRNLDQKWRNMLNSSEKRPLRITAGETVELFQRFVPLYDEMYARKQFGSRAQMQDFVSMQRALSPEHKMRVLLCEENEVMVSGVVLAAFGNCGVYLHGATSDQGMKSRGSYRLQWEAIKWLKERGVHYYDLGGINPESNPGVFHFKAGLSGDDVLYLPPLHAYDSPIAKVIGGMGELVRNKPWKRLGRKQRV